jgi:tetratricopeptide (TPR) repeat protein
MAEATASYRQELEITERLAKQDPRNADWQRNLSVAYQKVGNMQQAKGQLAEAMASYEQALGIAERLAKQDLGNADWQRVLACAIGFVASVDQCEKLWDKAADGYGRELKIARPYFGKDGVDLRWGTCFVFAVGHRWELMRDAPSTFLDINRQEALADLRSARDVLVMLQGSGRTIPRVDTYAPWTDALPWIDGLIKAAEAQTTAASMKQSGV